MTIDQNLNIVERPGQSGDRKQELIASWNQKYGEGNWKKLWQYNSRILTQQDAFKICEDAYLADSYKREDVWKNLCERAKDVYDISPKERDAGLDYTKQLNYTRFHDICIRNVLDKRGWNFTGNELLQIRWNKDSPDWQSENFDPGKILFHKPKLIIKPHLKSWWDKNSVEDFYQSNKVIAVLDS